jgi:hypothetical protein
MRRRARDVAVAPLERLDCSASCEAKLHTSWTVRTTLERLPRVSV